MNAEIVDLTARVLDNVSDWRHKALVFACLNPIGFYITMGTTLPEYLAKMDELEKTFKEVRAQGRK